ncbi:MAG TPA: hypothetical protein VK171_06910, partial [Fimbriimonas sp.]|nr:hypothetical protein [Fimbriimonas sp.]
MNKMDIDQLATKWQQTHDRVEEIHQMVDDLKRTELEKQNKWTAFRLKVGPAVELFTGGAIALAAGNFFADNWSKVVSFPLGSLPTVLTMLVGLFLIWQSVVQLNLVSKLDYANDVMSTQAALVDLRKFRARCGQGLILAGITFWNIPPIAVLQWIGSYDVAEKLVGANGFPAEWMIVNVIVGAGIALVVVLVARRLPPTSAFNRFVSDVFAGGEVERAERQLADIRGFSASV